MKIIQEGKLKKEEIIRETCGECGTIFEFARGEAKEVYDQRDGNYVYIECPLCKTRCYLGNKYRR